MVGLLSGGGLAGHDSSTKLAEGSHPFSATGAGTSDLASGPGSAVDLGGCRLSETDAVATAGMSAPGVETTSTGVPGSPAWGWVRSGIRCVSPITIATAKMGGMTRAGHHCRHIDCRGGEPTGAAGTGFVGNGRGAFFASGMLRQFGMRYLLELRWDGKSRNARFNNFSEESGPVNR